jgi:uncharacterized protein (TIGR00251 family)
MGADEARAWARRTADGWLLQVRARPGARRTGVVGVHGDALKVELAAPADAGRANAELVRFLAGALGVPKASVVLRAGERNRSKLVLVPADADLALVEPGAGRAGGTGQPAGRHTARPEPPG